MLPDAALVSDISRSLSALGAKFQGDVAEVFCTDRFTSRCREFGLHPGVALDKTLGWNVNGQEAEPRKVLEELEKRFNISGLEEKAARQN